MKFKPIKTRNIADEVVGPLHGYLGPVGKRAMLRAGHNQTPMADALRQRLQPQFSAQPYRLPVAGQLGSTTRAPAVVAPAPTLGVTPMQRRAGGLAARYRRRAAPLV